MSGGDGADTLAGLNRAVISGKLPPKMQDVAEALRDRLAEAVRVTVLGLPGSGKSSIINLLAGAEVTPPGVTLPVVRLIAGAKPRMTVTLSDGTVDEYDTLDVGAIAERMPLMVEMQADFAALRRITLMEVGIGLTRVEQQRAVAWAAERSDIAIWCTRDFGAPEQAAWTGVPDVLKDQGILLRTRIDTAPNAVAAVNRAERLGEDEFDRILPIDTVSALAARKPDGEVDRPALKASGGTALISAVLKMVERTRQALIDQGDLLLAKHPEAAETVARRPKWTPPPEPRSRRDEVEAPVTRSMTNAEPDLDITVPEPDEPTAAEDAIEAAETQTASETPPKKETEPPGPETRKAFKEAIARFTHCGADLISGDGPPDPARVVARSVKEFDWLCDTLEDTSGRDHALLRARTRAQDAADIVQLMQIEGGGSNAEDAAVLMLQMRRNLVQAIATPLPH